MTFQQIRSILKVWVLKLKYKQKMKISFKQNIEGRLKTQIRNAGFIKIGECGNFKSGTQLISDGKLTIGNHFFCNQNVSITCLDKIEIGNYVEIANNVVIVDHDHDFRASQHGMCKLGAVTIGNHVWIGANVVILRNTTISDNVVIGAGSVVSGYIPENTVIYQKRQSILKPFSKI